MRLRSWCSNMIPETSEYVAQTPTQATAPPTKTQSVLHDTLTLLFREGDAIILSFLRRSSDNMVKGAFSSIDEAAEFAEALDRDPAVTNVYVNLQQLKPGSTTDKRQDVTQYVRFLVDIDRKNKRVDGVRVNATEKERDSLRKVADDVNKWVSGILEAHPLIADSGNGFHLCWNLRPNAFMDAIAPNDGNKATYKECLLAIKQKFDSESVEIDTSLSEPEQIIRLWGTQNRRDPETPGRPHRQSRILQKARGTVSLAQLSVLASEYNPPASEEPASNGDAPTLHEDFDEAAWWDHYSDIFVCEGEHYGWQVTSICPPTYEGTESPGHRHTGSTLTGFRFDRGRAEFHCFSDDHSDMTFGQVMRHLNQHHPLFPGKIWDWGDEDYSDFAEDVTAADAIPEVAEPEPPQIAVEDYTKHVAIPLEPTIQANAMPNSQPLTPLDMPEDCLYGWLGNKARELHAPVGAAYMVVTSIFAAQRTTVCGNIQPNLFILLIAPPHGGKTVTMMRGLKSFSLLPPDMVKKRNLASDRGIYTLFNPDQGKKKGKKGREEEPPTQEAKSYLLFSREFKDTLNKLSMNGSSLAPVLCDLFDDYEGGTSDKFGDHSVMCCLNILGALPVNSPADFGKQFGKNTGGGFYDRFIYAPLPKGWNWNHEWMPNPEARLPKDPVRVPSFCYQMANDWKNQGMYWDVERDRLAEIALRLATIWTSANHEKEVTKDCMDRALRLVTWQEKVRHYYAAGVAENLAAECTSAIMTAFGTHRDADGKTVHAKWRDVSRKHNWHRTYGDLLTKQRDALLKDKVLLPRVTKDENGQAVKDASWIRLNED
jgi:hypothetical protein